VQRFEIRQQQLREGAFEIEVVGELDLAVADHLIAALEQAEESGADVLISLRGCEFIDSTGIAAIIDAWKRAQDRQTRLAVAEPTDQVVRLLEIVGLADRGLVFAEREEALKALGAG
jgi:anti-sigma B factor antagonist